MKTAAVYLRVSTDELDLPKEGYLEKK